MQPSDAPDTAQETVGRGSFLRTLANAFKGPSQEEILRKHTMEVESALANVNHLGNGVYRFRQEQSVFGETLAAFLTRHENLRVTAASPEFIFGGGNLSAYVGSYLVVTEPR